MTKKGKLVVVLLCLCIAVLVFMGGYNTGYDDGFDDGYGFVEPEYLMFPDVVFGEEPSLDKWSEEPPYFYSNSEPTEEERLMQLAEAIVAGITTANITIEFDNNGYTKGFISLYYNKEEVE